MFALIFGEAHYTLFVEELLAFVLVGLVHKYKFMNI